MNFIRKRSKIFLRAYLPFFTLFMCSCSNNDQSTTTENKNEVSETKILEEPIPETNYEGKNIKLALLLDTSNSMDGLIGQAKSQLWNIVNELSKASCSDGNIPHIEIALYEYGNDQLSASEGYIRQVLPLSKDLDKISEELFNLKTSGGEEYCGQVIKKTISDLTWSSDENDLNVIYIAGNENFNQGPIDFNEMCVKARKQNIIVNTIFCGDYMEGKNTNWKLGADLALGDYMCIQQDQQTVFISTPFDDEIEAKNNSFNDTYIGYGSDASIFKSNQELQDFNANAISKSNSIERIISKNSNVYRNENWDLVDAYAKDSTILYNIEKSELNSKIADLNLEQQVEFVKSKTEERDKIKQEIAALSVKREKYINDSLQVLGNNGQMLNNQMITSIKKQASKKGFSFK